MTTYADFYIDPVCPFCWVTSRWAVEVAEQTDLEIRWKFIALKVINKERSDTASYIERYQKGHMAGFRQLRLLAKVREEFGNEAVGNLYTEIATRIHNLGQRAVYMEEPIETVSDPLMAAALEAAGLPAELLSSANETTFDRQLEAEAAEALSLTGANVGTPIITFDPDGDPVSFFGPVLSAIPRGKDAVELWELVEKIARVPGFAELKRSMRDPLSFN